MDTNSINQLVLLVANFGMAETMETLHGISVGMEETQSSILTVTHNDSMLRMWDEISRAINPVATKIRRIENRYKQISESRKMIADAIRAASENKG